MGLKYRLISPEEEKLFDGFVANHPQGHILQTFAWGEVKAKTGWKPLRLVVEEDGRLVAAVSLLKRRLPYIGKSIFYAPRGPVVDFGNPSLVRFLFQAVQELARQEGAILLKIDPAIPAERTEVKELLKSLGFRLATQGTGFEGVQPRYVFRLSLTPSLEEIKKNFHPKTRYNLGLAQRRGVRVKTDCTLEDLPIFYELLQETALRDGFLIRSYDYFLTLWRELVERGYAKLFLAYYQGEPIAGTLAFILGDKAWYLYGASSNRHRNVMPNYLLQWTMICWAREQGCTLYDFRGVPGDTSPEHPLYGLYRFKKGFGGVFTEFIGEYDLVYSPFYYWLWRVAQPAYSFFRHLLFWRLKSRAGQGGGSLVVGED
ncbi:Lipid II:glycine glycyltransferase (Peptidoglycan interpeptide bridge formation enzyme) [Thermanaeromonas toyohensis ToBE]|uniref:Lipid II:glycine glycyltransferase (Peptidoglycan interpeptide bridge formation enzyme) n=1 Tax=Thermanaeromonas toyohensis ToBE TaxID=698762 RepID=A0A1W1W3C3_9FIRM|nr:peptidoglycan bridge formation glycyltransferase FemA/FemB family protein [Thermanaeromonas toyohensis]SMC00132.1 Lipid II:glycine glycyltransferase (Peptidoglycan interpeptide bridge formation enzyme) [Thermanaeromonas toyohensis ToBE]